MRMLAWLNQNYGAVTAVVTAIYALFTILLWRATKRQAEITRAVFEASHRPYVNVVPEPPSFGGGHIHFVFYLENRGAVPAIVTDWRASVRYGERSLAVILQEGRNVVMVVFPDGRERLGMIRVAEPEGLRDGSERIFAEAAVSYRGVGDRQFSTRILMELLATNEVTAWDRREVQLDP